MKSLRTPDARFAAIADFPYAPNYVTVPDGDEGALRMHYVDEGDTSSEVVLCLHGEPTWCYLYRKMIPVFLDAGYRVLAPDLVGFGRSDKPAERADYSYQAHVDWMTAWLERLDLKRITLVCQDWGGLIGLRLAAENPARFARIVASNTALPMGNAGMSEAFMAWRKFSQEVPQFPVGQIVNGGCARDLDSATIAAYDAPFPDESYKQGARQFPLLVPIGSDDPAHQANQAAWRVFEAWDKPFLTAFTDGDPVTRGGDQPFRERIPGAQGQPHTTLKGGRHFVQEDLGEELARVTVAFMGAT